MPRRMSCSLTELAELAQARTDRLRGMVEELRAARAERHEALVELQATRAALAEARSDGWVRPGVGACSTLAECLSRTSAAAHHARCGGSPASGGEEVRRAG